jgi:hypothetical protein
MQLAKLGQFLEQAHAHVPAADLRIASSIKLLKAPPPWERDFEGVLAGLPAQAALSDWPDPETDGEDLVIAAATSVFVEPRRSDRARLALKKAIGAARFEHLMLFLAFVRTAHYWTLVHPELTFEKDVRETSSVEC